MKQRNGLIVSSLHKYTRSTTSAAAFDAGTDSRCVHQSTLQLTVAPPSVSLRRSRHRRLGSAPMQASVSYIIDLLPGSSSQIAANVPGTHRKAPVSRDSPPHKDGLVGRSSAMEAVLSAARSSSSSGPQLLPAPPVFGCPALGSGLSRAHPRSSLHCCRRLSLSLPPSLSLSLSPALAQPLPLCL